MREKSDQTSAPFSEQTFGADSLYEILKCTGLTTVRLRFTLYLLTSLVYYKFIINYTKVVKIQTQVRRSDYYQTQLHHR